jgi:hypothetical protein
MDSHLKQLESRSFYDRYAGLDRQDLPGGDALHNHRADNQLN